MPKDAECCICGDRMWSADSVTTGAPVCAGCLRPEYRAAPDLLEALREVVADARTRDAMSAELFNLVCEPEGHFPNGGSLRVIDGGES